MQNMALYEKVRRVPTEAKREIKAGRIKGFTDINPMWRIKMLTEQFGAAGFGWYYEITEKWLERGGKDEVAAFVQINLFVKYNEEWSKPLVGVGGSSFVASESRGLYTSDECFKMALTDAISVACKALGIGADVYFEKDRSKYDSFDETGTPKHPTNPKDATTQREYRCFDCGKPFEGFTSKKGVSYTAGQAYHISEERNPDKKARCRSCKDRHVTETNAKREGEV